MNTWNHITLWKLFVLDKNTWYHITVFKNIKKQLQKMWIWLSNERNSQTYRHKIIQDRLICRLN